MFDSMFPSHWTTLRKLMWLKLKGASAVWDTISGNPVSFSAKAAPLRQLKVAFSPVQSGTGDPSPDNVRPISGWDSLNVEQRGKNLCEISDNTLYPTQSANVNYLANGINVYNTTAGAWRNIQFVIPLSGLNGQVLRFSCDADGVERRVVGRFCKADGTNIGSNIFEITTDRVDRAVNVPNDLPQGAGLKLIFYCTSDTATTGEATYTNIQLELGTTASEYTPYNPLSRSISISLGQTVYSGTINLINGVGNDSGSKISFAPDRISTWFNEDAALDTLGFYMQAVHFNERYPAPKNNQALFEQYKRKSAYGNDTPWEANFLFAGGNFSRFEARVPKSVLAPFSTYAESQAAVLAYLAEHPIVMWYEKAEPSPITLTPQEVQSLLGVNNMWSDANGDLTVEYRSN